MYKFQIWVSGTRLISVDADSEANARQQARDILGVERLPYGSIVCEISHEYYKEIVAINASQGFDASNM